MYDIINKDRFHHEIIRIRKKMILISVKTRRVKYNIEINLSIKEPSLIIISSTLNINTSRFNDLIHFEYINITKLLHLLFMNAILTSVAQKKYI